MTRQSTDTGLRIAARAPQVMLMALLCMFLAREASAGTCSASAFSCPASGTCIITGTWNIGSDCVLDFGTKAVELKGTFQAETQTGAFEVRAANLTLNGGKLKSLGDTLAPGGAISVVLTGQFLAKGSGPRIDTSGNSGGPIRISAATIDLQTGTIVADGGTTEDCGDGGIITLEAFAGLLLGFNRSSQHLVSGRFVGARRAPQQE
ncbi:hypothetical protein K2Z84_06695, partial [Candidatus Binatia bacterium]|nr:hypothetical protein [Candidatus Binatia bacterium]